MTLWDIVAVFGGQQYVPVSSHKTVSSEASGRCKAIWASQREPARLIHLCPAALSACWLELHLVSPSLRESACSPINILIINTSRFSQECYTPIAAESTKDAHKSVLRKASRGHALWWALGKWTFVAVGMVAVADGNKGNLLDYGEG